MLELCAERGYANTSVEAVIERAQVSAQAFAKMFDSKEMCVVAAHAAILNEVLAIVAASYSADRSEWDSAMKGIEALLGFMAAQPSVARFGYVVARQMGPPALQTSYDAGVRVVAAMLDRGREYSKNDEQPPTAAKGALGGPEAVIRREVMAGRAERLPGLLPDFVYGAVVPFLGQEEALRLSRRAVELLKQAPENGSPL